MNKNMQYRRPERIFTEKNPPEASLLTLVTKKYF